MGKFFKTAATITEAKEFIKLLKSKGVRVIRNKGNDIGVGAFNPIFKQIDIPRHSSNPVNTLFHEGGHALVNESPIHITVPMRNSSSSLKLLDERLANSRALDFLKSNKSKEEFKQIASKNYSLYKSQSVIDPELVSKKVESMQGAFPNLQQLSNRDPLESQQFIRKFLKQDPDILKSIRKNSYKNRHELKVNAWEI